MKYLSTFSGIGGFELGIQQAYETNRQKETGEHTSSKPDMQNTESSIREWEHPVCIGFSEIDKYATEIYQKHFPNHKNYGDITTINAEELPDFDLLVGGFPCQAFSIAGKRGGFEDTRGTMFFELARILKAKQPRLFVFENVKGLLSHDGGKSFSTIIQTLDELGYDLQWQVLNSKNHGVPQNRERVFIIGHLRGTSRPEVFPFEGTDEEVIKPNGVRPVITPDRLEKRQNGRRFKEDGEVSFTLTAQDRHGILQLNQPTHSNDRVYGTDGVSPTLNTMQGGNRQPFMAIKYGQNNPDRNGNTSDNMFTLKTGGANAGITDGMQIRRLTPTECERLQGFPDGWTEGLSDTQRYKTLGNAVTVNVIRDIFEKII
jgi:DNA (cytosine-5)-methyltransferase 1